MTPQSSPSHACMHRHMLSSSVPGLAFARLLAQCSERREATRFPLCATARWLCSTCALTAMQIGAFSRRACAYTTVHAHARAHTQQRLAHAYAQQHCTHTRTAAAHAHTHAAHVQASVVHQYRQVRDQLHRCAAICQTLTARGHGSSPQAQQAYQAARQYQVHLQALQAQVAQVGRGLRATRWAYARHRQVLALRVVQGHAHALEGD